MVFLAGPAYVFSLRMRTRRRARAGRCAACGFFFSSRRRHTSFDCDWSSDVCSSDLRPRPDPDEADPRSRNRPRELRAGQTRRSEERRVGKECRSRGWRENYKNSGSGSESKGSPAGGCCSSRWGCSPWCFWQVRRTSFRCACAPGDEPGPAGAPRAGFFFQAEDGIRALTVTGVQTCALPICDRDQTLTKLILAREIARVSYEQVKL